MAKDLDEDGEDKDEKSKEGMSSTTRSLFKMIMMLKQAQFGATFTDGTTLPGFTPSIDLFGQNFDKNTPGLPFILGAQDETFRNTIAANGFLTTSSSLGSFFICTPCVIYPKSNVLYTV